MLSEAMRKAKVKDVNKTLKLLFDKQYEREMWIVYRTDKTVSKWIKRPTVANIEKWLKVWDGKLTFKKIDYDYFEFVKRV